MVIYRKKYLICESVAMNSMIWGGVTIPSESRSTRRNSLSTICTTDNSWSELEATGLYNSWLLHCQDNIKQSNSWSVYQSFDPCVVFFVAFIWFCFYCCVLVQLINLYVRCVATSDDWADKVVHFKYPKDWNNCLSIIRPTKDDWYKSKCLL